MKSGPRKKYKVSHVILYEKLKEILGENFIKLSGETYLIKDDLLLFKYEVFPNDNTGYCAESEDLHDVILIAQFLNSKKEPVDVIAQIAHQFYFTKALLANWENAEILYYG